MNNRFKVVFGLTCMLVLCVSEVSADLFRNNCVSQKKVAVLQNKHVVVQQQKIVQVVPAAITFVPSQVLLNSQVTLYNPSESGSGLGYSYQGSAYTQSSDRISDLEKKVDELIKALVESGQINPPVELASIGWQTVLKNRCVKCHGDKPKDNDLSMVDVNGVFVDKLPRYEIYRRMTLPVNDSEHMPKNGGVVPLPEQEHIRSWVNQGLKSLNY